MVVVQPTTFCNIDCGYCYLPNRDNKSRLSEATLVELCGFLKKNCSLEEKLDFLWHSGEPLSVGATQFERYTNIVNETLGEYAITHNVQTNGILLSSAWIDLISRHGFNIGISIDGPESIHDCSRKYRSGAATYVDVMTGINLLKEAGIEFSVLSVVTPASLKDPKGFYDFFSWLEPTSIGLLPEETLGDSLSTLHCQSHGEEEYRQFIRYILGRNLEASKPIRFRDLERLTTAILSDTVVNIAPAVTQAGAIISMDVHGNVSTFSPELLGATTRAYSSFHFGNVRASPIIFDGKSKFNKVLREINSGLDICKSTCSYWRYCGGGSPADKIFEAGRFDVSETAACRFGTKLLVDELVGFLLEEPHTLPVLASS